jgi:hypothetical protein
MKHALYEGNPEAAKEIHQNGGNVCCHFITRTIDILSVMRSWGLLVGKTSQMVNGALFKFYL